MTMTEELSNRLAENFLPEEIEEIAAAMKACQPVEISCIAWMDALEASVASAISHWHEFGPEHEFEKCVDWMEVRLKAYRRHKESASIGGGERRRE